MSGGVSMGKFDYLPLVCEELGIEKLFHKIKQRPGKPFGSVKAGIKSLCLHSRQSCFGIYVPAPVFHSVAGKIFGNPQSSPLYAILGNDIEFLSLYNILHR